MDFKAYVALMEERARQVPERMQKATQDATDTLHAESKAIMNRDIYSKPVDKNKKGKPKWRRAGGAGLRGMERAKVLGPYTGAVDNSARHALPRHNLGYGPGSPEAIDPKPVKAKNTTRKAPFRTEAIATTRKKRFEIYRSAMRDLLGR